ncbi:DUF2971 domain-containing protein [Pseudomonas sp. Irchel 3H3]|uniref:DUF2971 domain-containing protein n=1 Tax=Pseudomonas sp. Irchel 3H3 TaxID=2009038 RepID=UPI000BA43623|nr:DUF2971 domain-containing protein [Pseudomonas sp. Irchel 3H3]
MPQALFKYMPYSTADIVLKNQTLRWSTPATLNDPYDIQFDLRIDFDRSKALESSIEKLWKLFTGIVECSKDNPWFEYQQLLQEHYKGVKKEIFAEHMSEGVRESFAKLDENIAKAHQETRQLLSTVKILCLTDSPLNQLMWAYYADSNKGAVLRFEDSEGTESPCRIARQIDYRAEMPMLYDEEKFSDIISGFATTNPNEIFNSLIYTKSEAWSHEREWRICSGDGRNKDAPYEDLPFDARELTGVIFGCRMPKEQKLELSKRVRQHYPHAELLEAVPINHSYQLTTAPFEE